MAKKKWKKPVLEINKFIEMEIEMEAAVADEFTVADELKDLREILRLVVHDIEQNAGQLRPETAEKAYKLNNQINDKLAPHDNN